MMDLLSYIRSLIFQNPFANRKRRATDDFESSITPKFRRISSSQMSGSEDDWISTASSSSLRRRSTLHDKKDSNSKFRTSWLKENCPITVDDDDDIVEIKKPSETFDLVRRSTGHVTSTPNCSGSRPTQNGDDDVTCLDTLQDKKRIARKQGFDYIRPPIFDFNTHNGSSNLVTRLQNGARKRDMISQFFNNNKDKSKSAFPILKKNSGGHSAALDQSFRLDEKRKYKELLNRAAPGSTKLLLNTFAEYTTPVGKLFTFNNLSRGKKMVEMSRSNKKPVETIDLTSAAKSKDGVRLSTRDTIKKVLNEHDNDVVVVKDSDSEVEVLPAPPSPKPDFQIEKRNSLKTYVDRSEAHHDDWISNLIKTHREEFEKRQKLIEEQKSNVKKHNDISDDIRSKLLDESIRKCLHIKDALIPDEVQSLPTFPRLNREQEAQVRRAIDKSLPSDEVLARKFNLNITRRDLLTLDGLNWLNDEIINFYMNLIIERGTKDNWPKSYAFNTFFYLKVSTVGQSSVRRWTRKIDIFTYDVIAVPIHLGVHWCMAVIDFRMKTITYYDSMGGSNRSCLDNLLQYLYDEHMDKKKIEYDTSEWRLINAKNIPQQMNGSDCGVFSCTFAEVLTRDGEITFSQENMPYMRRKMIVEILESRLLIS